MELSKEQKSIAEAILSNIDKKQVQSLGGLAGTGKTVMVNYLHDELAKTRTVMVCAPTGKAVNVLKKKGLPAQTLHSALFRLYSKAVENVSVGGVTVQRVKDMTWSYKSTDREVIIVDESSMVEQKMYENLVADDKSVIFVGDHGQLPPVKADYGVHVMANPDYKLETVHRNAGPIAEFCHFLRGGFRASEWKGGGVRIHGTVPISLISNMDQIIVGANKSRVRINELVRIERGFSGLLQPGEVVVSLLNNKGKGLWNGSQGLVYHVADRHASINFDGEVKAVRFLNGAFGCVDPQIDWYKQRKDGHPFDYAYAITCHKSQGSEWDKVCVVDESKWFGEPVRWRYTAASRAKESLLWCDKVI